MDEKSIIKKRIDEVRAESETLRAKLAENDRELVELETAEKVIARLTASSVGGPQHVDAPPPPQKVRKNAAKRSGASTMPELILMALEREKRPLEPREITEVIRTNWWPEVEAKKIGSIVWRLYRRDDIVKIEGTSAYRLPQKEEAPDDHPGGDTTRASLSEPDPEAQGLKAWPGGGT